MKIKLTKNLHKYAFAIVIFSLSVFFYLYEFAVRTIPSAITQQLMRDFSMSAAGLGFMTSLFYYGYVSMQIPVGLLYDRFGVRLLLTSAMAVCSLGTLLFALAPSLWLANIAYFLAGFSGAFAFVGCLVIAARWFPPKYFAFNVGMVQFMGCVGAIVGQAPITYAAKHFGWRHTTLVFALIGFVGVVAMALMIRDRARRPKLGSGKQVHSMYTGRNMSEIDRLKQVLSKAQNWWAALYVFGIWSPIVLFAGLFGIPFLVVKFNISTEQAAVANILLWLGIGLGTPAFGWWSDRIGNRRLPMAISALIGLLASVLLIYYQPLPLKAMYVLLFFFGVAAAGQAISFGVIKDNNAPNVSGTAIGFQNMAVIIGGIMLQPIAGSILKHMWDGAMYQGAPAYSLSDYHYALILVPLSSVISLIAVGFFLKETRGEAQYELEILPQSDIKNHSARTG